MVKNETAIRTFMGSAIAILIAYLMRILPFRPEQTLLHAFAITVRHVIHISLLIAWCIRVHRRLINTQLRHLLITVGALLAFWLMARTVKYDFVTDVTAPAGRYLWYSYYIPMILVPALGVFIVYFIDNPENQRLPKHMCFLLIPAFILIGCVLTNDLHQLVFAFPKGIVSLDREYTYGFLYYIVMAWFIILGLYFGIMLLKKSRVPGNKKTQKLLLIIMLGAIGFWALYSLRLIKWDLTAVNCLIVVCLLESAIQSGMIPSNTNHQLLFAMTTLPVLVVDKAYQPHYTSQTALSLSTETIRKAEGGAVHIGNNLLRSAPINAGLVVWQDDIRELNELTGLLRDVREQISEENTLLQAELELQESQVKIAEQNRLYDRITREVTPQLHKIDELLRRVEAEPENTESLLAKTCVLGSYIKRRGNLLLLGEESDRIVTAELEYCIRESLDNLRLGGVFTMLNSSCKGEIPIRLVVAVYDFYENLVEKLLDNVTAMLINLTGKDGQITMNIQIGCTEEIAEQALSGISLPCGSIAFEIMEEDVIVNLCVTEGGEQV